MHLYNSLCHLINPSPNFNFSLTSFTAAPVLLAPLHTWFVFNRLCQCTAAYDHAVRPCQHHWAPGKSFQTVSLVEKESSINMWTHRAWLWCRENVMALSVEQWPCSVENDQLEGIKGSARRKWSKVRKWLHVVLKGHFVCAAEQWACKWTGGEEGTIARVLLLPVHHCETFMKLALCYVILLLQFMCHPFKRRHLFLKDLD